MASKPKRGKLDAIAKAHGELRRAKKPRGPGKGVHRRKNPPPVIATPTPEPERVAAEPKRIRVPAIEPRHYQVPVFEYWDELEGPGRAVEVWARRCGKDLVYASVANMLSFKRRGLYLHFLPEFAHARRTLWDGFDNEGNRFIDTVFPRELRKTTSEQDMRIELKNGAVWQLGGSDQYDRWVSGNPIWTCFSEAGLTHPKAWEIMRPILKINGGHAAFIGTPRGYNNFHQSLQIAKREASWRHSVIDAITAGVMTQADINEEIRLGMPEELARQEYLCDFSAANVGAILGRYVEAAEREQRITLTPLYDPNGQAITVTSDIGFRDTAAWWFWQPVLGGFNLVDYLEGTSMDAEDWIAILQDQGPANRPRMQREWPIKTILLPHDARAKTFQSKHSAMEQFLKAFPGRVKIGAAMNANDKVNAGRSVMPRCRFDAAACAPGLLGLRAWSYKYDEDRKNYSKEPDHNWASHPSDAFCYGAAHLADLKPEEINGPRPVPNGADRVFTLEQLYEDKARYGGRNFIP